MQHFLASYNTKVGRAVPSQASRFPGFSVVTGEFWELPRKSGRCQGGALPDGIQR